jgi:iron(III) transport system substrate-binding protein
LLRSRLLAAGSATLLFVAGCTTGNQTANSPSPTEQAQPEDTVVVYSGRSEELVGPLIEQFSEDTGIDVQVRYGDTAELAAQILTEGENSPADVYFAQDAGALGALAREEMLTELPSEALERVEERFRSPEGVWVGISGRARVVAYNTDRVDESELPDTIFGFTDPEWQGRIGWAPTNGSFQSFVTAMRVELGDDTTREWLEGMVGNGARVYENNTAIVEATGRGEIDLGLVNHYYLYRFLAEDPAFAADNAFLPGGDVGALVNVAGAGILETTDQPAAAREFVAFLQSDEAQQYFSEETFEYPLVSGVAADEQLPPLATIETPDLDLSDLDELEATLELLRQTGALS